MRCTTRRKVPNQCDGVSSQILGFFGRPKPPNPIHALQFGQRPPSAAAEDRNWRSLMRLGLIDELWLYRRHR